MRMPFLRNRILFLGLTGFILCSWAPHSSSATVDGLSCESKDSHMVVCTCNEGSDKPACAKKSGGKPVYSGYVMMEDIAQYPIDANERGKTNLAQAIELGSVHLYSDVGLKKIKPNPFEGEANNPRVNSVPHAAAQMERDKSLPGTPALQQSAGNNNNTPSNTGIIRAGGAVDSPNNTNPYPQ